MENWCAGLWRDIRLGWRSLLRRPGFTAAIALTLALGIGSNTAIFTLLKAVFLHPVPGVAMEERVALFRTLRQPSGEYTGRRNFAYADYLDLRQQSRALSGIALYQWLPLNLAVGDEAERVTGTFASDNYFEVLGLTLPLGRFFTRDEAEPGGEYRVAVLSHAAWQRYFAADPGALGRKVRVNGQPFEIVGIAPQGFAGTEIMHRVDVWVPISAFPEITSFGEHFAERGSGFFRLFGRLAPATTAEQAGQELTALNSVMAERFPDTNGETGIALVPLLEATIHFRDRDSYVRYARSLAGAVALILLVGAINVANLLLVRGMDLAHELAIRQALGGRRRALIRRLLAEFGLLFALGAGLSLPLGALSLAALWRVRPPELAETSIDLGLDWSVLLFAGIVTGLTVVLCAALPALRSSQPDLLTPLKAPRLPVSPQISRRTWGRSLLVVGQLALAMVALAGAGLYLRNLAEARSIPLGFNPRPLLAMTAAVGDEGLGEERTREEFEGILAAVRALPGVEEAALAENRLLRGALFSFQVFREGEVEPAEFGGSRSHRTSVVTPGFFATAGIPLLAGADFDGTACRDCPQVAVVNRTLAETLWPGEDPIGKRLHLLGPTEPLVTVIGVAEDSKYRYVDEKSQFFLYLPFSQHLRPAMTLHVRTAAAPETMLAPIREVLETQAPGLPLGQMGTMQSFVDSALWIERTSAFLLAAFALLALLLAVMGVYSLMAFSVRQRQQEIGVRLALGAHRVQIFWMVLQEAAVMAGVAAVVGLAVAFFLVGPFVASQLHGSSAADLRDYLVQSLLLAGATLAGSFTPARRAARLPPAQSLRGA